MNIPEVKLERSSLSAEQLFSALASTIRDRGDRFSPTLQSTEAGITYFDFEDSLEEPPVWTVRLTLSKRGLFATIAEPLDSEIGEDIYFEALEQATYVILSLFDAEAERITLRRVDPH